MKVSVTQLRLLMIVVNIGLAVWLLAYYVQKVWVPEDRSELDDVEIRKLVEYRPDPSETGRTVASASGRMASVSNGLQPPKPRAPVDSSETEVEPEPDDEPDPGEIVEGGPLSKEWEYVWILYNEEDPLSSRVKLRKKQDAGTSAGSAAARRATITRRRVTASRSTRTSALRRTTSRTRRPANEEILLVVKDRFYKDETLGVEFYIDSADVEKLVYRMPDSIDKVYSLKRVAYTRYEREDEKRLEPEPEEEASGEDGDEKKKFFRLRPRDFEDKREDDYRRLVGGERTAGVLEASSPRRTAPQPATSRRVPTRRTWTTTPPRVPTRTTGTTTKRTADTKDEAESAGKSGPITDPEERRKAMEQLKETTSKIPPEAREKINEALRGPRR